MPACSRMIRQRVAHSRRVVVSVNEVVWAVSRMHGPAKEPSLRPREGQISSLAAIQATCDDDSPPRDRPASEAALRQLLGFKASYSEHLSVVEPCRWDLVSCPSSAGDVNFADFIRASEYRGCAESCA